MTRADLYKWRNFHNFKREDKNMECKICKNKTTIDTSVGKENFIVCQKCYDKLTRDIIDEHVAYVALTLFRISDLIEKNK